MGNLPMARFGKGRFNLEFSVSLCCSTKLELGIAVLADANGRDGARLGMSKV